MVAISRGSRVPFRCRPLELWQVSSWNEAYLLKASAAIPWNHEEVQAKGQGV